MAITVDHATKIITVPQADCTFVSGTFYRLPTKTVFQAAIQDLLDDEEGIVLDDIIDHNTEYTVAGVTYAPKIEVINSYQVQFTPDTAWSVELTESNNNLWDVENGVLVQNNVQVIPTNSAGLIAATLTGPQITQIAEAVWDALLVNHVVVNSFGWFVQRLLTLATWLGLRGGTGK